MNGGYCLKDQKLVQVLLNVDTIHMPPAFNWASRTIYVWDNDDTVHCLEYQRRWKNDGEQGLRRSLPRAYARVQCVYEHRTDGGAVYPWQPGDPLTVIPMNDWRMPLLVRCVSSSQPPRLRQSC